MSSNSTLSNNAFKVSESEVEIVVYPWLIDRDRKKKTGITLDSLKITETIGGDLASGTIVFSDVNEKDLKEFGLSQNYGTLEIKDLDETTKNRSYTINFLITSRSFQRETLKVNIVCISKAEFINCPVSMSYNNIDDAIKYLSIGNKFYSNIGSDTSLSNLRLIQMNETNYDFLRKLCMSYKKDTVFSFGFEGISIKDIQSSINDPLVTGYLAEVKNIRNFRYDERLEVKPKFPWAEIENSPKNPTSIVNFDKHYIVGKPYETLLDNYLHNLRLYRGMYSSVEISGGMSMPLLKIGDVINLNTQKFEEGDKYELPEKIRRFVVAENTIFYASSRSKFVDFQRRKFSYSTKLLGLDRGDWCDVG